MKTKLSFLVLPLCLGLLLTFVLAACSDGNPAPNDGTSSGSQNPNLSSSNVYLPGEVDFLEFTVVDGGSKVYIDGTVEGTTEEPIVKVEFITTNSGWISNNSLGENPKTFSPGYKAVTFSAEIDLNEPSIKCSDNPHTIKVMACNTKNKCATDSRTFNKPDYLCALSSSGGAVSSSSEAVWVFGSPQFADVPFNSPVTIGSGSVKMTGNEGQPDIEVSNGKIRMPTSLGVDDDVVSPGKSYSSKENALGSSVPTKSKLEGEDGLQNKTNYLIYLNDGSKYIIYFEAKTTWPEWPKKCTYWPATESP